MHESLGHKRPLTSLLSATNVDEKKLAPSAER